MHSKAVGRVASDIVYSCFHVDPFQSPESSLILSTLEYFCSPPPFFFNLGSGLGGFMWVEEGFVTESSKCNDQRLCSPALFEMIQARCQVRLFHRAIL